MTEKYCKIHDRDFSIPSEPYTTIGNCECCGIEAIRCGCDIITPELDGGGHQ